LSWDRVHPGHPSRLRELFIRVLVVSEFEGDLHGHFKDLVHIIKRNGDPSPRNIYVFNGDFVDRSEAVAVLLLLWLWMGGESLRCVCGCRGPQGLEVLIVLFAWKVMYPEYVHLNRGNHEDRSQNQHYCRGKHGCWVRLLPRLLEAVWRNWSTVVLSRTILMSGIS
jgi:hypothetical protein